MSPIVFCQFRYCSVSMFVKFVLLSTVASSFIGQAEVTVDGASRKSSGVRREDEPGSRGLGPSSVVES